MRGALSALPVCLGFVALAGCGMPQGDEGQADESGEGAEEVEQVTGALGAPRISCPTAMRISGPGAGQDIGSSGLPRPIRASLTSAGLTCTASGAAIPLGATTTPPAPFSLSFGQELTWSISGPRVTFAIKALGITLGTSSFTCPARSYGVAASTEWSFPTVTGTATPSVIRSGSTVAVTCRYSLPASSARVTRPAPSGINWWATGSGFYSSADLTTAEKTQICTPQCNTSCTSGFTGGHTEGIAECINSCIASCIRR
jgi:hypothetical protein